MKNLIKKIDLLFIISLLVFYACQKPENKESEKKPSTTLGKTAGSCKCSPKGKSSCWDDCIVKDFMDNKDSREFVITWESCNNNALDGQDCQGTKGSEDPSNGLPYKSNVKFCYMDWTEDNHGGCTLLMEIDFLPRCIKCISGFPRCIKFRASCDPNTVNNGDGTQTTTTVLNLVADDPDVDESNTDVNGFQWTVTTTTGDPKIKICCERKEGNFTTYYCCTGDIQPK